MRIVLLGAPGSGKGTQAEKIVDKYGVAHISTGEVLRAEVAAGTALGLQAKQIMDAGNLVSDDVIINIAREHIGKLDSRQGFLLDGFPRTLAQAEGLDKMLAELSAPLDAALLVEVDDAEVMQRLLARKRADDTEETIRNRLGVYRAQTEPLIGYYRGQSKLVPVQGTGAIDEIFARVTGVLDPLG